jgi:hypothetical protein
MLTAFKNRCIWAALASVALISVLGSGHRRTWGAGFGAGQKKEGPTRILVHVSTPVTAQAARTWMSLSKPVDVRFPNTPLEDALKQIRESTKGIEGYATGIPIYLDPMAFKDEPPTEDFRVAIDLTGVPLASSVELLLKQRGLTYAVNKDGIVVITSDSEEPETIADPYPWILDQLAALRSELAELRREIREAQ